MKLLWNFLLNFLLKFRENSKIVYCIMCLVRHIMLLIFQRINFQIGRANASLYLIFFILKILSHFTLVMKVYVCYFSSYSNIPVWALKFPNLLTQKKRFLPFSMIPDGVSQHSILLVSHECLSFSFLLLSWGSPPGLIFYVMLIFSLSASCSPCSESLNISSTLAFLILARATQEPRIHCQFLVTFL